MNVGEVAVTEDGGGGVVGLEGFQEGPKGGLLLRGAGVGFYAFGVDASFVADADGVLVVVTGMGTDEVLMAGLVDFAVAGDVVVVSGEAEALLVVSDEFFHGVGTVFTRGAAVDDDEFYLAHGIKR